MVGWSEFCAKNRRIANSARNFGEFCANSVHFLAHFSTLKLPVALLYDPVCHTSIRALFYLSVVCSFVLCAFLFIFAF